MANIKRANTSGITKTGTAVPDVPDAPTIGTATDVGTSRAYNNGSATVAYTAAATGGAVTTFTATSTPGGFTATGSSPITVTGLQSGTAYTFAVAGTNATATGPASSASSSITATTVPQAPTIGTFTDGGTGTTGTLSFTAGATGGSSITGYKYSTDGSTYSSASGTTSPLSLTGLTAGTYTFTLKATNTNGDSSASSGVSGTVIQPNSFESIATATPTSGTSVTFSSIPSTYKHLQIRAYIQANSGSFRLQPNGSSSTSNYAAHLIRGDGSSVIASGAGTGTYDGVPYYGYYSTDSGAAFIADIIDYASTSKYKTIRHINGIDINGGGYMALWSGLYLSTSAVSSLTVTASNGFTSGTRIALYGIKA